MNEPALLFSGGLDSVCALHLLPGVRPVYVRIGHRYETPELDHASALVGDALQVLAGPAIGSLEESDGHIRHRNAALVITAAAHGYRVIYLGALRGEASPDKSGRFMRHLTQLLTTSEAEPHIVEAPFAALTKTGLLDLALRTGLDPARVLASRSCYGAGQSPCGECQACFRRWVALVNNGMDPGYLPDLPRADVVRHLRRAGVRRWRDLAANNADAARAVLRQYDA